MKGKKNALDRRILAISITPAYSNIKSKQDRLRSLGCSLPAPCQIAPKIGMLLLSWAVHDTSESALWMRPPPLFPHVMHNITGPAIQLGFSEGSVGLSGCLTVGPMYGTGLLSKRTAHADTSNPFSASPLLPSPRGVMASSTPGPSFSPLPYMTQRQLMVDWLLISLHARVFIWT